MSKDIAKHLLNIEAVFLNANNPFVWSSGIVSPIYCDNRLILSNVDVRNQVEEGLAKLVIKHFPSCTNVVGTATAGIAHSAIVAHILKLKNAYVRTSVKKHGRSCKIEGTVSKDDLVVVVEDLISTGLSVLDVVKTIEETGTVVLGVVSIFSYELMDAKENFLKHGTIYKSLTNIYELCEVAVENKYISETDKKKVYKFIENSSCNSR